MEKRLERSAIRISKVNRSTIVRLEDGSTKSPSLDVAFALADALKVDVRILFYKD